MLKTRTPRTPGARRAGGSRPLAALEHLTPAERRRLMSFVQRRHWPSLVAMGVLIGVGSALWILTVTNLWIRAVGRQPGVAAWFAHDPFRAAGMCLLLLLLLPVGPLYGLLIRDRWIARALALHTAPGCCHDCAYPLHDIPADIADTVTCPECGQSVVTVVQRGRIPSRLIGAH